MKNVWSILCFGLLALTFACDAPAEEAKEETEMAAVETDAAEEKEAAPEVLLAEGANYATKLLEDGIPSPRKEMTGTIGEATVTVNYGSPSVRGRKIWGGLEKYDKVWRSGANAATTITFSKDVKVAGQDLAAGTYVLLTIPTEGEWTVIFTEEGQSAFSYDEAKDALRVMAQPATLEKNVEQLQYVIEGDAVALQWEKLSIPFAVEG